MGSLGICLETRTVGFLPDIRKIDPSVLNRVPAQMMDSAAEEAAAKFAQVLSQALSEAMTQSSVGAPTSRRTSSSLSSSPLFSSSLSSSSSSGQLQETHSPRDAATQAEQARTTARLHVSRRSSPESRAQATHGRTNESRDDALQRARSPRHRPKLTSVQAAIEDTVLGQLARTRVMPADQPNRMIFPPLPPADTVLPSVAMALHDYEERLSRLGSGAAKTIRSQIALTQLCADIGSPVANEEAFGTLIKIKAWTNWAAKCHDAVESIPGLRTISDAGIARVEAIERLAAQAQTAAASEMKFKLLRTISTEAQRWSDSTAAARTCPRKAEGGALGPRIKPVQLQASRRLLLAHRAYINRLKQADSWTRELNQALENTGAGSEAHGSLDSEDIISDAMALLLLHPEEKPRQGRGASDSPKGSQMKGLASPRREEEALGGGKKLEEEKGSPRRREEVRGGEKKPEEEKGSPRKREEERGHPRRREEARGVRGEVQGAGVAIS